VFDTDAGTLRFASAGHPAAWLWHDREVRPLRSTGPLLMLDPQGSYHSREIPLAAGDLLLLYTDGLAEVRNGEQMFGEERIANSLRRDPNVAAGVLCKNLLEAARDIASEAMGDDVAILAIRRTWRGGAAESPYDRRGPLQRAAGAPDRACPRRKPGPGRRE